MTNGQYLTSTCHTYVDSALCCTEMLYSFLHCSFKHYELHSLKQPKIVLPKRKTFVGLWFILPEVMKKPPSLLFSSF